MTIALHLSSLDAGTESESTILLLIGWFDPLSLKYNLIASTPTSSPQSVMRSIILSNTFFGCNVSSTKTVQSPSFFSMKPETLFSKYTTLASTFRYVFVSIFIRLSILLNSSSNLRGGKLITCVSMTTTFGRLMSTMSSSFSIRSIFAALDSGPSIRSFITLNTIRIMFG